MDFDFADVLAKMIELRASDLHLTPGAPPMMRMRGEITPVEGLPEVSAQQSREIVYSILNEDQRKRFENLKQLDFAYSIPSVARFRVNCFFQRGCGQRRLPPGAAGHPDARRRSGCRRCCASSPASRAASSSSPARPARASRRRWRR